MQAQRREKDPGLQVLAAVKLRRRGGQYHSALGGRSKEDLPHSRRRLVELHVLERGKSRRGVSEVRCEMVNTQSMDGNNNCRCQSI
jgi:hypothetical protein